MVCSVCGQNVSKFICGNCVRFMSRQEYDVPSVSIEELEKQLEEKLRPGEDLGPLRAKVATARNRTASLRLQADTARQRVLAAQQRVRELGAPTASSSSSSTRWPSLLSSKKKDSVTEETERLLNFLRTHSARKARAAEKLAADESLDELLTQLRVERKRVCSVLVSQFPLKKIARTSTEKKSRVITLGAVTALELSRVTSVSVEEQRDIQAALGFLVQLVSHLAYYLDVTLPFPCGVCPKSPRMPAVYRPLRKHWYHFTVQDGSCTKSFAKALKFLREDLRRLCETQGISVPLNSAFPYNTAVPLLKLLDACLHARHFGTMCPPFKPARKCTVTTVSESNAKDSPRQDDQSVDEFSLFPKSMIDDDSWIVIP